MRDTEIKDTAPGKLVSYGRESYYRPEPLPPSRDLEVDAEFYDLLADATFWLGKLSGVSLELDFPPVLYTSLLRKEAMESAEIEGADVDYNALYSHETRGLDDEADGDSIKSVSSKADTKDTQEVLNYEQAIEEGIELLDSESIRRLRDGVGGDAGFLGHDRDARRVGRRGGRRTVDRGRY